MMRLIWKCLAAFAACCLASAAYAQPLSGTYTCANGNPGNAFDYADVGVFLTDLVTRGIGGPTVLDLYDDGGDFLSNASYTVSSSIYSIPTVASPLTIRAAASESPVIRGSTGTTIATLDLRSTSNVTFEGLTFTGGDTALRWWASSLANIRIAKCRFHSLACAIDMSSNSGSVNVTIENNMIWNCTGGPWGVIQTSRSSTQWVFRHNTIVKTSGSWSVLYISQPFAPWERFENNIIYFVPTFPSDAGVIDSHNNLPAIVDGNVWYLGANATVTETFGLRTPAEWRASGRDINGLFTDPLLTSVTPGLENLYLQNGSPARDLAPTSAMSEDIDGRPRPGGPGADAGAHEFYLDQELEVQFQSNVLGNHVTLPVGTIDLAGHSLQFSIRNAGIAVLTLTATPPVAASAFMNCTAVVSQPSSTTIAGLGSATFSVFVDPTAIAPISLQLTIRSDDALNDPYVITLDGSAAQLNNAAVAAAPAGSSFSGPPNGPLVLAVDPGGSIANADVELTDAEGDIITISSLLPPATIPTGIAGPTAPPPGQPLLLIWAGIAQAANPPGNYSWSLQFADAVNGNPVASVITIAINDLPPVHTAAMATGSGSYFNPYQAAFTMGDTPGSTIVIATVTDANVGQAHMLSTLPAAGNPVGVGFQFLLSGGALTAAPAGVLSASDVGVHQYDVFISDASNTVAVSVELNVNPASSPVIGTSSLPPAKVGHSYSHTLLQSGGVGPVGWSAAAGQLPPGLSLDSLAGVLAGVPTAPGQFTLDVVVTDSLNQTDTRQLILDVLIQPTPSAARTPDESGCGLYRSGTGSSWVTLLGLLSALCVFSMRRRVLRRCIPS